MLLLTALCLRKDNGFPSKDGQLSKFTDIYRIDVTSQDNPIETLLPVLRGIHVKDDNICIPHDIIVSCKEIAIRQERSINIINKYLCNIFVEQLSRSKNNCTGGRRYIP